MLAMSPAGPKKAMTSDEENEEEDAGKEGENESRVWMPEECSETALCRCHT